MNRVEQITIADDEGEQRLDRWFKRRFPALGHGQLEKLLRTGQVRVDGARAKANQRVSAGQVIRIPPLPQAERASAQGKPRSRISDRDAAFVRGLILYQDDDMLVLNKPAGLAVQGGSKTTRHLDGLLDALQFDAKDRPRLVHRLDRDTSGVIILARTVPAAARLARQFQSGEIAKVYWAVVHGRPRYPQGTIDAALAKSGAPGREKMTWDDKEGRDAVTDYITISQTGDRFTWLQLMPRTGRTHQLRAHCALMDTPIVGDAKYGAPEMTSGGALAGLGQQLCLHAKRVTVPRPGRKPLTVDAPLPVHMKQLFDALGFAEDEAKA
ncbi:MAG: RluA family pseudouridine synthase [Rhodospirillaceae bacterium]|nr:RluA family pseudouridine synthase [Rhodospirillaceae bacterium]